MEYDEGRASGADAPGRSRRGRLPARHGLLLLAVLLFAGAPAWAQQMPAHDPLPSWNKGEVKLAILNFVADVTRRGAPTFVDPADRIAVFDNDGTLWSEQPVYVQLQFALDRVTALAPLHPEWSRTQPFRAALEGDTRTLIDSGERGIGAIMAATHAGMTTDEFRRTVLDWIGTARHPRFGRPYTELVYQPMLDLLQHLRDSGFKTFIVSGGGVEFMRPWVETVYGIPPEQVVGSSGVVKFETGSDGAPVLVKVAEVEFVDDGPGKPVGINRFIGRRPILAFGNSDGDLQMLQYTAAGNGPRFMGLVHHSDAEREWAYDRSSHVGRLDKALDEATAKGWVVTDMKRDWAIVFPRPASGSRALQ